jgi:class 3 adenylate cyclase/tetratricopeptide (TPR) repeat protein
VLVCPACGAKNIDKNRFCGSCGGALGAPGVERRRLVTSVFCDLSGSTALGETADAEAVYGLMSSYFESARTALERHGGTVEKFIGDAVVGMFGVPDAHEDDALRACRAALEIQTRVAELNIDLEARMGQRIAVRIGVNTGEVVAGESASSAGFASGGAVVLGDALNVAARLEQGAAPGEILIGEPTYRLVRGAAAAEVVEPLVAKGKAEPLLAYRLTAVNAFGPAPRRSGTPFVGRSEELARLESEFEAVAVSRSCRLVTIVGEAGVGKSRLAVELVGRIAGRFLLARGNCLSYGEGITYWAIGQIVRELAGIRDDDSVTDARAKLAFGEPAATARLEQLLGLGDGRGPAAETEWAIRRFLSAHAAGPLLVMVDDIQWGEPALLDLLGGLPGLDSPILVLCLARPELLERSGDWEVTVRLEPLGEQQTDALLESLGASPEERSNLVPAAAGNPLFAEELAAWAEEGSGGTELPASLNALIGARLDRLEPEARDILERGAIEGELFHGAAVVELSAPEGRADVLRLLETLGARELVRRAPPSFTVGEAFRFKHLLVRDAAHQATAKKLRAALHEGYAGWLERVAGERAAEYEEILGYHLEQSCRYLEEIGAGGQRTRALGEKAAGLLASAGRRALARADPYAASNLLERALRLGVASPVDRARILGDLGMALNTSGRMLQAEAARRASIDAATALGERELATWVRISYLLSRGSSDPEVGAEEMERAAHEAIELYRELEDPAGLAAAEHLLGVALGMKGRQAERLDALERALAHSAESAGIEMRRRVIASFARTLAERGPTPVPEAIARCEALLADEGDDQVIGAVLARCLAMLYAMAGREGEALEHVERSGSTFDELRHSPHSAHFRTMAVEARRLSGDQAGAERELTAQWEFLRRLRGGEPDKRAAAAALRLADLYCDEGRWEEAERFFAEAVTLPDGGEYDDLAQRLAVEARLASHDGRTGEAVAFARRAVEEAERSDDLNLTARMWTALGEQLRAFALDGEADAAKARALELYRQKGNLTAAARLGG